MYKTTHLALAASLLAALCFSSASAQESTRPYKIGTCDWSIKMQVSEESFQFAKQNNLDGIQYSFDAAGDGLDLRTRENRDRVRAIVKETGVAISSLGIGLLNKIPLATTDEADQLIADCLDAMIKLKEEAAALDDRELAAKVSPNVVLLAFFGKANLNGNEERMATVIRKLKRFAPIAEKHGFILGIESLLSEADHRRIMEGVGSPAVKVYYDTANSARMGYDIYKEIESLGAENICEVHLKQDAALLGNGNIDFNRVKSLLDKMKYTGWLIIEGSTPKKMSRTEATEKNAVFAKQLFGTSASGLVQNMGELVGDWSLTLDSKTPAWLSIRETTDGPLVHMRLHVDTDGPHDDAKFNDGRLKFTLKQRRKTGTVKKVDVGLTNRKLDGSVTITAEDGGVTRDAFTGKKIPPVPTTPPDLSEVRFGHPVSLFNGKDLTGWRAHEPDKIMGWSVKDGVLVNTTPKTDFSATGAYANLRTEAEFEDFWLHIEFNIGEARNSGVYLRGMYEAQVVDRDSWMQGLQGVGAIFGRIAPSKKVGKKGGEWQTYDLTLVDRHVTVVLNGETVIDNQPVAGPTGGAVFTDPTAPGPIHLQGDHTSVKYRDIYLAPVVKD
jgi:sugar phosphate isomerase/epimerase